MVVSCDGIDICGRQLSPMVSCQSYFTGYLSIPKPRCCKAYTFLYKKNASCLCRILEDGIIDQARVLSLNGICDPKGRHPLFPICPGMEKSFIVY